MSDDTEAAEFAHIEALEAAGICVVCETAHTDAGDVLCAPCRQDYIDRSSEVVDPVERVLDNHARLSLPGSYSRSLCLCGWSINGGPGYHRRHVAERIYAALGLEGPAPWIDGPKVVHPEPRMPE